VGRHLPNLRRDLLDDLPVVDDLVLEGGRGGDLDLEEVMSSLCRHLGFGEGPPLVDVDVVDDDLDAVPLAPAPRVFLVPPLVVPGDVVVPLGDTQRSPALVTGLGRART
jgi:hypothetical protein